MSNVNGIVGYNRQYSTVNKLFAAFGNDIIDVGTGLGYSLNLNSVNNIEFENFLDTIFFQNYSEDPKTYNAANNKWDKTFVGKCMVSKYIRKFKTRLYLGYCKFGSLQTPTDVNGNTIIFPNRVFYSDTLTAETASSELTWGLEWGQNGATYAQSNLFYVESAVSGKAVVQDFLATNIKVGDTLYITNYAPGTPQNPSTTGYLVQAINDAHTLVLDKTFGQSNTGLHFWVGGNWFDIGTEDNDVITGLLEAYNRLMVFKNYEIQDYSGADIAPVRKTLGTTSARSIIADQTGAVYWFHGSDLVSGKTGIYMRDNWGLNVKKISRAIDPYLAGMDANNFQKVIAWQEGSTLRWFLGNVTNSNFNINITNAVASYNFQTSTWSVDSLNDIITCATTWITNGTQVDIFAGNSNGQVLKMNTGYDFNGTPISLDFQTKPYYPQGTEAINKFYYVQVVAKNAKGVRMAYKIWDNPRFIDDEWTDLGELSGDKTEFTFKKEHKQGSGIQYRFTERSSNENELFIEKISTFYEPDRTIIGKDKLQ